MNVIFLCKHFVLLFFCKVLFSVFLLEDVGFVRKCKIYICISAFGILI